MSPTQRPRRFRVARPLTTALVIAAVAAVPLLISPASAGAAKAPKPTTTTLPPTTTTAAPTTSTTAPPPQTGAQAGAVTDLTWGRLKADQDRTISLLVDAGVRSVRANVNWKDFQPDGPTTFNSWWVTNVDYVVGQLKAKGIEVVMPVADGVPYWASADPGRYTDGSGAHWNQYWRPRLNSDYATFVGWVARHYAPLGVHAYEVWNEPNYARFWPSGPNAADYAGLLKAAYPAIKAADPTATVVLGGLSQNDYPFLQQLYAAGVAGSFDVAAVHPYSGDPTVCWTDSSTGMNSVWAFCGLQSVHTVMANNGDGAKAIWLSEFGWSTCSCTNGVTEQAQADYLQKAFNSLQGYSYVTKAFFYNFRNNYWQNNSPGDIEANYGLLRTDYSAKPAYAVYKAYAHR